MIPHLLLAAIIATSPCTPREIMTHIATIAADSMRGRLPGSLGDSLSVAYLASTLQRAIGSSGRVTLQSLPVAKLGGVMTNNIIATIPGEQDEWVVVTAHHDGLGVGKPDARGDSIYNGANDNAVGAALAVCVAQNLQSRAGRRGVVVILTAAEEQGHVGARYWAEHPTVDLKKVHLAVNLDAIGVTGPTLDFIAYGNGMLLGADSLLISAGARAGFALSTVPFESNMYWAFDSAEMGAAGVPAFTIGQGTRYPQNLANQLPLGMPSLRQRYHAPSDEIAADWDPAAILRYAELATAVMDAARTDTRSITLRMPNAYQVRP